MKVFNSSENIDLASIATNEVDWYAQYSIRTGIKLGLWVKVGKATVIDKGKPLFRNTYDYERAIEQEPIMISDKWVIWQMNEDFQRVGKLEGANKVADIGMVMTPNDIIHHIKNGSYDMPFYPSYS